jgi:Carboxypeptidase regulatory-like domain
MPRPVTLKITLSLGGCCLLGLLMANPARGDNVYGKIRGTVTDPTGGVISGAKVTATNTATGISATVTSAADGSYEFLQLAAPAAYAVRVEQPGFRPFEARNLSLSLDQIYVLNIKMELGTVSQQITVEAAPAQVETTSMQLGKVLSAQTIVSLPLNGRNWVQLQQTLPGVVASSDRLTNNYSTNGSRSQSNDYLVNGVDANDLVLNSIAVIPNPDAIAEVSVVTNTINPEYGRNGGAVLNAETKSGSNQIHGTGFEFYRDTSLNTRNFFSPSSTIFHQNQFGGVIGGPIKKNKAFFFFAYQGTRNRQPDLYEGNSTTVFSQQERNGDFSAVAGGGFPATNPATGLPALSPFPLIGENGQTYPAGTPYATIFPTGQIPVSDFNTQASNLTTKFVPLPNAPGNAYQFNPVTTQSINQYIARIDFNLTSKDSIYFYWFIQPQNQADTLPLTGSTLPGFGDLDYERSQQYALPWVHTFGGTMVNEARLGYQRLNFQATFPQQVVQPSSVGFPGINPNFPGGASYPKIDLSGGGLFILGFSNNGPQPRIDQTYQFNDNFSWVKGRHTMKLGFSMRRSAVNTDFNASNNGTFTYNGAGTYSTGVVAADFLLGIPDSYLQESGNYQAIKTQTYYTYAQDQFKLRPNLTLTYGVGWEIDTPLTAVNNGGIELNCYRPGVQSSVFPTAPPGLLFPGDPTCNSGAGATTKYNHFGPRLGFAWSPGNSSKWSVRGGYGIYFNRTEEELALQNLTPPPFALTSTGVGDVGGSPSFTAPFTSVTGTQAIPNKFPFLPPATGSSVNFVNYEPFSLNVVDPNLTVPYTQNYNVTVERQLPASMILSVGYVGLQGRKLTSAVEVNPAGSEAGNPICAATPGCNSFNNYATAPQSFRNPLTNAAGVLVFGSVGQQGTFTNSNYNAFQVSLSKKFTHGLALQSSYVWSHSLDGASSFEDLGYSAVRGYDPFNAAANYGDSEFDARQRFVISYTYYIPSRWHSGVAGVLANGWQMSGITTFQTGFPVTIGDSSTPSATCDTSFEYYSCWDRPNTVAPITIYNPREGVVTYQGNTFPNHYFNPASFSAAAPFTLGNAGRNFFHGPGINNFDWALHKVTPLHGEKAQLELRFEFYNLFNHTQFTATPGGAGEFQGSTNGNFASSNFGRVTGASAPNNSRIIQLGAKIIF